MNITEKIRQSLKTIIWRKHARIKAENDNISESGLEDALRKGFILVEDYPDDLYGESALLLIYVDKRPVHVALSPRKEMCYLITAYLPDSKKWNEKLIKRRR